MIETARRLLDDIRELAPGITTRTEEIEAARRVPLDLVETLKSIGVFRIFVPRSHGGLELDLPAALEVISALGKIDGSVGWTAMIGSASALFAPLLPRESFDLIYGNGPDTIIAGSTVPVGTAEAVPGGWRVNGRWPFASGCHHADWMFGACIMSEAGKPLPVPADADGSTGASGPAGESGPPLVKYFMLPARDWRIEDSWFVSGLKGTGSDHIAVTDKVVPATYAFDIVNDAPCLPGPLYQSMRQLLPVTHGAFVVGVAEGALDDLIRLAQTGRRQTRAAAAMRESEIFQSELGRVSADIRAARAFLQIQIDDLWRHALAGTLKDEALFIQGTQAAIWLATTCSRAAEACFMLGGGSAIYETSPLQRRLRDLQAAAQHAIAHQRHYVGVGKLLLGNAVSS